MGLGTKPLTRAHVWQQPHGLHNRPRCRPSCGQRCMQNIPHSHLYGLASSLAILASSDSSSASTSAAAACTARRLAAGRDRRRLPHSSAAGRAQVLQPAAARLPVLQGAALAALIALPVLGRCRGLQRCFREQAVLSGRWQNARVCRFGAGSVGGYLPMLRVRWQEPGPFGNWHIWSQFCMPDHEAVLSPGPASAPGSRSACARAVPAARPAMAASSLAVLLSSAQGAPSAAGRARGGAAAAAPAAAGCGCAGAAGAAAA